jgi:hypothetical protein
MRHNKLSSYEAITLLKHEIFLGTILINIFMEGLGAGTSLETLLQKSQQHTVLLSDLRENSEVIRKTDEKTLSQLQKLQQAASQTLEVAKARKQQSKETSNTLKAINETTINANAINSKRQTSALNTLSKTIDVGLNVVNQKMFSLMEKLGSSLAGAFASVGRSLENKLYNLTGSLSIVLKPLVGIVKIGFSMITKLVAVPLKMLWEGFKAFNQTLFGKITTTVLSVYLMYKFLTGTAFGDAISNAINNYRQNHKGGVVDTSMNIVEFVGKHPKTSIAIGALSTILLGALTRGLGGIITKAGGNILGKIPTFFGKGKAGGNILGKIPTFFGKGKTAAATGAAADIGAAGYFTSKKAARKYLQKHNINTRGMSEEQMLTKANSYRAATEMPKPTSPTINSTANATKLSKLGKFASVGGKLLKMGGGGIGSILGGGLLDYIADKVENKTVSGLLNVGSAALSGALLGRVGGPAGMVVGGILGAGASLLAGEGGKKLFGSSNERTDMDTLSNMTQQQVQAANAQIHTAEDTAESLKETNKILTRVVEKMSTDAQQGVNRREASSAEQARQKDAAELIKKTGDTNALLDTISKSLESIANALGIKNMQVGNKTSKSNTIAVGNAS